MKKRGKVLRSADSGPGLLMVDGQQYVFSLEGMWKSEVPPRLGMVVEVEFEQYGKIHAIYAIAESQVAREQTEAALTVAKEKGSALVSSLVARFGLHTLVATGLLIIGWVFLAAASIQTPLGKLDFTFWQMLGFLNSSNSFEAYMQGSRNQPSAGFYGFLALLAIVGPFLHHFWNDERAALGGVLPLLFMAVIGLMIRSNIESSLGGATGQMAAVMKQMRDELMAAISLGFGSYLSGLVSLYFAAIAVKQFRVAQGGQEAKQEKVHQAAA
jgi:hypothetical protein